jgi:hypothetical protein
MRRDAALTASLLFLETLALYVTAAVLAGGDNRPAPPFVLFVVASGAAYLLARALRRLDLPNGALVALGGLISAAVLLTLIALSFTPRGFPPEGFGRGGEAQFYQLSGAALLIVAWARAAAVARRRVERVQMAASFSIGMAVLAFGLLFGQDSTARDAVNAAAIPLVASGLLGLALIHQRDARELSGEAARGPWLTITAGSVVGLAVAGVALGVLPLGPLSSLFNHSVAPVLTWLLVLLVYVSLIVSVPLLIVLNWLIRLVSGGRVSIPQSQSEDASQVQQQVAHAHPSAFANALMLILRVSFVIAAVLIAAYIAYRLFGRLKEAEPDEEEERETMEAEGSLREDLAALLRGLRPHRPATPAKAEPNLPAGILAVRRLYLTLLERSALRGVERPPQATPAEFEPALVRSLDTPAAAHVSAAFAAARYSRREPSSDELRRLSDEVARLPDSP